MFGCVKKGLRLVTSVSMMTKHLILFPKYLYFGKKIFLRLNKERKKMEKPKLSKVKEF
jgi:hypothetical protein